MNESTNHIQKEMERKTDAAFQAGIRLGKKIAATPSFCPVCDARFDDLIASTDKHLKEANALIRELRGIPNWITEEQFEEVGDLPEAAREAYYLAHSPEATLHERLRQQNEAPYLKMSVDRKTETIAGVRI